ncbi:MAG TPA: polysaccharide deacetylase family protein [Symbiobacteriaceae bacterium]|nr:polysaccharide deacetylase family protein [Symbiobacteriaceae bacterium]
MKKQTLPLLLLAALLAACTTKPQPVPQQPPASVPAATTPEPPKTTEPAQPPAPKVDPIQAMGWYESDIGYPMKSDDPKAVGLKVAMLTFDDGPTKDVTPQILDVLKREKIRAIFFVTGYGIEQAPDMLKRIAAEGHIIAVHTMTHPDLATLSQAEQRKEIVPVIAKVKELTGITPTYIRPPFGSYNKDLLALCKELGLTVTTWSNGSLDWDRLDSNGHKDPQKVVDSVLEQLTPGSNILMHDTHQHTADALPTLIKSLRDKGYQFVTLGKG